LLTLAAVIAGCLTIYADVHQSMHKALVDPNDFVTLYAGAICTSSDCNPYSVPDLDSVVRKQRGNAVLQDWTDQLPIYPPTTVFLLKPLAGLPYQKATLVWYVLSLSVYVGGVLWVFVFSPSLRGEPPVLRAIAVLLALHFPKMIQCLGFGNPSLLVTGLMLFSVFDDVHRRYVPRVVCAAIAVWLKFTSALPLMLLVLFADRIRLKRAWLSAFAFAIITSGALLYAGHPAGMHHWATDLRHAVALGEQNGMSVSGRISPSNVLLNAANIPGYFTRNPLVIAGFVVIVVGLLAAVLLTGVARSYRSPQWERDGYEVAVPAVAVMSLLPVYHRFCDIGLLIFVLPWLIRRLSRRVDTLGVLVTVILGLLYFSWERRIHLDRLSGPVLRIVEFLYYRGDALLVLTLAALLVAAMYHETLAEPDRIAAG
jgi:hypothetical protein